MVVSNNHGFVTELETAMMVQMKSIVFAPMMNFSAVTVNVVLAVHLLGLIEVHFTPFFIAFQKQKLVMV